MTGAQRGRRDYSTQVSEEVQAIVRATVRGVKTKLDPTFTKAALTEEALIRYCRDLQESVNDGRPWPTDNSRLPPGRSLQA
jgi:hypothetical protein